MEKSLTDDYKSAGFGATLGMGQRPAFIIVDMVMAYFDRASPLYAGVETALASTRRVLAQARERRLPVIFTRVVFQPGGRDGGVFYKKIPALKVFDAGSPLGAFAPGLEPRADEIVITKQYPSAFFGTSLASTLVSLNVDSLLIAGLSTSGCVRATTLDAIQHSFIPIVIRQAVGDRDPRPHEANLFDLQAKYADVVDEDAVIKHLANLRAA